MNASGAQTGTLTLSGTAAAGDVLQGKTFYNTDAKTVQTGTLVVSGSSGNATAGDVLKGKTFMNASGPATGTLELTGNAVAANVLSGKTFYSTDAKTKLTGSFTVPGNATAADVLKGKTFISNGSTTTKTGTLQLSGTAAAGDVLQGKTFYNTDAKTKITGTIPTYPAGTALTNLTKSGANYKATFPAGYWKEDSATAGKSYCTIPASELTALGLIDVSSLKYQTIAVGNNDIKWDTDYAYTFSDLTKVIGVTAFSSDSVNGAAIAKISSVSGNKVTVKIHKFTSTVWSDMWLTAIGY